MKESSVVLDSEEMRRRPLLLVAFLAIVVAIGGIAVSSYVFRNAMESQYQAALKAFREGDLDSVATLSEALRGFSDYASHKHLLDGMVLLRSDQPVDAITEFGMAKDHPDTQALALALSGECLYTMQRFTDAERLLKVALSLDPSLTDAHRCLSAIYYDIGAMNQAMVELETVAARDPTDSRPHRLMGLICRDYERYQEATTNYRESLRRAPNQPHVEDLWIELAECLLQQTVYTEALEALSHCADTAQSKALEAACYYAENRMEKATEAVDAALEFDPNHMLASRMKATLKMDANDLEAAVTILDRVVQQHPYEYETRYQLAGAYRRLGKLTLAETQTQEMERLRKLREDFNRLHLQAIEDPTDDEARYQMGILARQLGKPELAHGWFVMTLAMNPGHEGARQALQEMARGPESAPLTE